MLQFPSKKHRQFKSQKLSSKKRWGLGEKPLKLGDFLDLIRPVKTQVPETQEQLKDQLRVILQGRQGKPPNQEAGLRSKAFNNRKPRHSELKQYLGSFWG